MDSNLLKEGKTTDLYERVMCIEMGQGKSLDPYQKQLILSKEVKEVKEVEA